MFGSAIIDVIIGLFFLYALLALVNSALVEAVNRLLDQRGACLMRALRQLFLPVSTGDATQGVALRDLGERILESSALQSISRAPGAKETLPSYISPSQFADTVVYELLDGKIPGSAAQEMDELKTAIDRIDKGNPFRGQMVSALRQATQASQDAAAQIAAFRKGVEQVFDQYARLSQELFKRNVQKFSLLFAFLICAALNADTIAIGKRLAVDKTLRESIANQTVKLVLDEKQLGKLNRTEQLSSLTSENSTVFNNLSLFPLGWGTVAEGSLPAPKLCNRPGGTFWANRLNWLEKLAGILVTAFAVSLGAGFWFDLLQQVIRVSGRRLPLPGEDEKEKPQKT